MKLKQLLIIGMVLVMFVGVFVIFAGDDGGRVVLDLENQVNNKTPVSEQNDVSDDILRFGFDVRSSPQEDARQYLPFLAYLERTMGYQFELRFSSQEEIIQNIGTGVIQFAAIGATSYIQAEAQYGVIPLARGLNTLNQAEYQSMIVVVPDSSIQSISDLSGQRFAFGSVNSTQGHLIPRIMLGEFDLNLENFALYQYTGSHRNCVDAVVSGQFDACGMQDTMAQEFADLGFVRILATSPYFPSSGIAANKDVPTDVLDIVTQALLDFQPQARDADGLYHWDRTEMPHGFIAAQSEDYAELRDWMIRLDFLEEADTDN